MKIKDIPSELLAKMADANKGTDLGDDLAAELELRAPKRAAEPAPKRTNPHQTAPTATPKSKPQWRPSYPKNNPIAPEYYDPKPPCELRSARPSWVEWVLTVLAAFAVGYFWHMRK